MKNGIKDTMLLPAYNVRVEDTNIEPRTLTQLELECESFLLFPMLQVHIDHLILTRITFYGELYTIDVETALGESDL
jgi:hypothetical protein